MFPYGRTRTIVGTDPAAGLECSDTVPLGFEWRLMGWAVNLVTAVAVANRAPVLLIDDAASAFSIPIGADPAIVQAASLTWVWAVTFGGRVDRKIFDGTWVSIPGPSDLWIRGGYRIRTSTLNIQGADNYGAPRILVEERPLT